MQPQQKKNDNHSQFLCPIVYKNVLPDPLVDAKFLPCGKSLQDFVTELPSFPEQDGHYEYPVKGLHLLFDIDLVNQHKYESVGESKSMDPRDAALLFDIEEPKDNKSLIVGSESLTTPFATPTTATPKAAPRTALRLPHPLGAAKQSPLSCSHQVQLINKTFRDIEQPLLKHPTNPCSSLRPLQVLPIFPDLERWLQEQLVSMQFDIPPNPNSMFNLLKDCGNCMLSFQPQSKTLKHLLEELQGQEMSQDQLRYISDQKYKQAPSVESQEKSEHYVLREHSGQLLYCYCEQHIKLRRVRPRTDAQVHQSLLKVERVPLDERWLKKQSHGQEEDKV